MGDLGRENPTKSNSIFLQIVENPDGSISRPTVPLSPPTGEHKDSPVHSKDVPLNPAHKTWLRIYRPNLPSPAKLPIIIYFHGGGFVVFSAASFFYHDSCELMATSVPAVVVSLDYRLAPESPLPAAYDDAVEALHWVRAQALDQAAGDPWLVSHGDFSRCFLMGSSSGANMAYHTGLHAMSLDLEPVKLPGLILNQPYLGGVRSMDSELGSDEDPMLPLRANHMMWRLSLPSGADRDHEFCNVAATLTRRIQLPRCFVNGCAGDPLIDRQRELVKGLEGVGVSVVARLEEGGFHANELFDPAEAQALFSEIREFIHTCSAPAADLGTTTA